ncbi:MAG: Threonine synthase [Thermodesulfobacterium sp.]|uniref:Threonine synthase n=1 Tax=Candidatus Thermodesulfobacterium syntrophicum TaxID=3060442 RepID=A0AAE3TFS9_9BACT|nr:Threonine synthase [Candidatus Thermodesulfobacterium syntrophicum]
MKYVSTRGGMEKIDFKITVFEGLAPDGGLIVPESIPELPESEIEKLKRLSYQELALEIFKYYVSDIKEQDLRTLIKEAYKNFRAKDITPVVKAGDIYILELFHGPTWAFKDIALQFLGVLFEKLLLETGKKINILGATSGDTGSAAIYGVKGKKNIAIFILHPYKKVSEVQALMMTTVTDPNVYNLAIEGTFDDCQAIVKSIFMDLEFKKRYRLTSVNSINWARIMAQMVYYFWTYFRICEKEKCDSIRVSVPTGNFGDIFAGYLARKMLGEKRIERLILATNENDILCRFVNNGDYSLREVKPTISPSMDIQVASNFERYIYYFYGENPQKTKETMEKFAKEKTIKFSEQEIDRVKKDFLSTSVNQKETMETIKEFYEETGYILDPHTAVGVRAGLKFKEGYPLVCLATAHPAKFPETVNKVLGFSIKLPKEIEKLYNLPQKFEILPADTEKVKTFISQKAI